LEKYEAERDARLTGIKYIQLTVMGSVLPDGKRVEHFRYL